MAGTSATGRVILYAGVVAYLLGQAYDQFWHSQNVSFVPAPPSRVFVIHIGIYLGAAAIALAGALHMRRAQTRRGGAVVLAGGLVQLAGFALDTWVHSRNYSEPLFHDMWWYGFGIVVIGAVVLEYRPWRGSREVAAPGLEQQPAPSDSGGSHA